MYELSSLYLTFASSTFLIGTSLATYRTFTDLRMIDIVTAWVLGLLGSSPNSSFLTPFLWSSHFDYSAHFVHFVLNDWFVLLSEHYDSSTSLGRASKIKGKETECDRVRR